MHQTTLQPQQALPRHYERARDLLAALRPHTQKTRQQRIALYQQRATRKLPLFGD